MNNVLWRHLTERLVKGGASSNDGKQALSLTFPRKREGLRRSEEGREIMTEKDGGSWMRFVNAGYSLNLFGDSV